MFVPHYVSLVLTTSSTNEANEHYHIQNHKDNRSHEAACCSGGLVSWCGVDEHDQGCRLGVDQSLPETLAVPDVGLVKPVNIRIVVVLPAPLGLKRPKNSPPVTVKLIPSTATIRRYRFVRLVTSIAFSIPHRSRMFE